MGIEKSRITEIWDLHTKFIESLKKSLEYGMKIGELLTKQKSDLKHGQFGIWIDENLPFSRRTAQNYMKVYRERDRLKNATVSHLTDAYRVLEDSKEDARYVSDLPVDEIMELIKDINTIMGGKEYHVSMKTGWFFKNLRDDESMTKDEMAQFELASNIYCHLCYFRHHIWHYGTDELPPGLVGYVMADWDANSEPKHICGGKCNIEW